jgi:hypothetical protein
MDGQVGHVKRIKCTIVQIALEKRPRHRIDDLFAQAIGEQPDRTALPGVQDKISGQMVNMRVRGRAAASAAGVSSAPE